MPVERNPAFAATERERSAVDRAAARLSTELRRSDLLPMLHALQEDLGWLPEGVLHYLADRMNLPFPDVWGAVTFYALFRLDPPHGAVVHVCDDVPCRLRGADSLLQAMEARYGPPRRFAGAAHGTPTGGRASGSDWETVPCLGQCDRAPVAVVAGRLHPEATVEGIVAAVDRAGDA